MLWCNGGFVIAKSKNRKTRKPQPQDENPDSAAAALSDQEPPAALRQ
jgi:hypothetical protein